ncbi:MAG: type II toxin-antitoxin system VapC family toxin [Burkholderiales bacterium]
MRLLLDTHIALWAIRDDAQLSTRARSLIVDPDNAILVSAATVWEISIKHALRRTDMPLSGTDAIGFFREAGYELIPVSVMHAALVGALPPHHADPFDRMLVAQARSESAQLLTHDRVITKYGAWVMQV